MSIDSIRQGLTAARRDGKVDVGEVDRIMLQARDGGGLDAAERAEVLKAADGFDDAAKQRVLSHLSAMDQQSAWVNVETPGQVAADGVVKLTVEGQAVSVAVKKGDSASTILARVQGQLPKQVTGLVLGGDVQPWDPALFTGRGARKGETAAHLMMFKPEALGLQPGEKPLRVVVTGYGAFMGLTDNPSANMAQKLAEGGIKGAIVEYRRLDVTPAAVDAFVAEMKKSPPDVILSMGVTGGQAQVEELPENHLGAGTDGNGREMKDRAVRAGGAQELHTDLPVDTIDWALQGFGANRQVFTSKSDPNYAPDRSAYLCNYLGYNLATEFGKSDATTAGFMHVTPQTPVDQMQAVLQAVAARQLDWRRNQHQPVS
jgi:pyrrolidone-carboxylate peptidase